MAFMRAEVSLDKENFLISDDLDEALFCKYNQIDLPPGEYNVDDEAPEDDSQFDSQFENWVESARIAQALGITHSFEIVEKFWGMLSAPGYMDRTDYILGDSQADVAQQMLDLFFDGPVEDMDDDELDDFSMLMGIIRVDEIE